MNKEQINTFREMNKRNQSVRPLVFNSFHKDFINKFIGANLKLLLGMVFMIFLQVILELTILTIVRSYLYHQAELLNKDGLLQSFVLLLIILGIYLIVIYFAFYSSRKLMIYLLNNLRRKTLENYLGQNFFSNNFSNKALIMARLTYHFSLIQMGFINSVTGVVYVIFSILSLLVLFPVIDSKLLYILPVLLIIYILLAIAGYYSTKKYLDGERTMSTRILEHFFKIFSNFKFIKRQARERESVRDLDVLVNFDTYFKIKRNVFMNFSNRILFVVFTFLIGVFYVVQLYWGHDFIFQGRDVFTGSIILGILFNLGYVSLNIGLYFLPMKIGVLLSVPQSNKTLPVKIHNNFTEIRFHTPKARLKFNGIYHKKIDIRLETREIKEINMDDYEEAHNLAKIFTGQCNIFGKPFVVDINGSRQNYLAYCRNFRLGIFVDPDFICSNTIAEVITGRNKEEIDAKELERLYNFIKDLPEAGFIFSLNKKTSTDFDHMDVSLVEKGIVQLLSVLWQKPSLVVIDRVWSDLAHSELDKLIAKVIERGDSSVVIFKNKNK